MRVGGRRVRRIWRLGREREGHDGGKNKVVKDMENGKGAAGGTRSV